MLIWPEGMRGELYKASVLAVDEGKGVRVSGERWGKVIGDTRCRRDKW